MLLKAPFLVSPTFATDFGYRGSRRFVALYWSPCGDEACFDDGEHSACGLGDNWLYLDLVRRPDVSAWRDGNGIHLGDGEREAEHWLILDTLTGEVYAAGWMDARLWVFHQTLPG